MPLVPHRVRIPHVKRCAVVHEPRHRLHRHLRLIQSGEWCNFDLGLILRVASETEGLRGRVPRIPEVIASLLCLHVNPLAIFLLSKMELLSKSNHSGHKESINKSRLMK